MPIADKNSGRLFGAAIDANVCYALRGAKNKPLFLSPQGIEKVVYLWKFPSKTLKIRFYETARL